MSDGATPIAEITSRDGWAGLIEALRRAVELRRTTYEKAGELAGLAPRYCNKLLSPIPTRNLGPHSFGPMLGALAIKIIVVSDEEVLAAIQHRIAERKPGPSRNANLLVRSKKRKRRTVFSDPLIQHLALSRRMLLTTPNQRIAAARKAAKARWRKPRVSEVQGTINTKG